MSSNLIDHFSTLEDPRIERNKKHQLIDIIVLTVTAVCSGATGWESIEDFGHEKRSWLKQFVPLANGIPSHDCIQYVLSRISISGFRDCFLSWAKSVTEELEGEIIAIDGKTARGSKDSAKGNTALHMVSAWACQQRLVLGQMATDEKSNEITAIPKLLDLLEIKGCIVTLDAMGCQQKIVDKIIEKEGDYVVSLKGNQGHLHEAVKDFFETAHQRDFRSVHYDFIEEIEKDHGRLEVRKYWVTNCLDTLPNSDKWKGLKSIGMVERTCTQGEKTSIEQRYFIASIDPDAQRFAQAVRSHWGIENPLHWRLDVTFKDDECQIKKNNGADILTSVRHLCMNLFELESSGISLAKKRRKAMWSDSFREKVIFSG